jgi:choline transport protein
MANSIQLLVCTGILSSCSRLGWRMAEDNAFPWSHRLLKIDHRLQIPLNFIYAIMAVEVIIGLISLGSELAYNAIVSGAGVCFALSYAIPVVVVSTVRSRHCLAADSLDRLSSEVVQFSPLALTSILAGGDIL